ncbi:MAG: CDP-alcohol phosphatidyltransferase family protein [Candidatus Marinimicrobia bacterium]|nr:CDP-alcohol phosphatidyltransferase family protein [Candidatus Neomarinimicrobiota bacterium]MBL7023457.1 CDP-alcohol phosphatidyltransferase family protein [Candidatus Neomarinimicrobiota bacterium]MBL7109288.1 CDP-alcohol phosphatidyltransferase family protein [Candidatus Neomarinimicrobiota bacterium]
MIEFVNLIRSNYKNSIAKSNVIDFWTVQICRRIASVLVALLIKTPLTPNVVSWLSFFVNLIAGYFLLQNSYIISASLYWLSFILDCADGQLAIQRTSVTTYGKYLDLILDAMKDIITFGLFLYILIGTNYLVFGLFSLIIVSISNIFDWVNKTVKQNIKHNKEEVVISGKNKYGIVFWSGPIRNFIIVMLLFLRNPAWVCIYSTVIGGYLTFQKGYKILSEIKKSDC